MAEAWQCDLCKKIFISGTPDYHDKRKLNIADSNDYDMCDDCSEEIRSAILDAVRGIREY